VTLDGATSKWFKINAGVPQGSILAHRLFLMFINDLPECLNSLAKMYADDSSLFSILQGTYNGLLQEDLAKLEVWDVENDAIFNAGKTKVVLFTKARNIMPLTNLTFFGRDVERVSQHKHLGITLTNKRERRNQHSNKQNE
jgi:hypothetical protein